MFHYLSVSVGSSHLRVFIWFVFLLILCGRKFGPQIMQALSFCPIIPIHFQVVFCIMWRAAITVWGDAVSLLMEDEGQK